MVGGWVGGWMGGWVGQNPRKAWPAGSNTVPQMLKLLRDPRWAATWNVTYLMDWARQRKWAAAPYGTVPPRPSPSGPLLKDVIHFCSVRFPPRKWMAAKARKGSS